MSRDGIAREAILSGCGRYRYSLTRVWGKNGDRRPYPARMPLDLWVMLNPSTADAEFDDPTIRRCIGFSKDWGAKGLIVVNLFPWRATEPKDLLAAKKLGEDVVDRARRDHHIGQALGPGGAYASRIIVAWGATPWAKEEGGRLRGWAMCPELQCLGTNANGSPKHPLYLKADTKLRPWPCDDDEQPTATPVAESPPDKQEAQRRQPDGQGEQRSLFK